VATTETATHVPATETATHVSATATTVASPTVTTPAVTTAALGVRRTSRAKNHEEGRDQTRDCFHSG